MSIIYHGAYLGWTITADNTKPSYCHWKAIKNENTLYGATYDYLIKLIVIEEKDKYLYPSWKQNDY